MKKFKKIAISCLFALSLAGLAGCNPSQNSSDTGISQVVKVVGLDLAESASVDCGFTTQLTATVLPETATNKNVTWSSEDNNIATVDQTGLVTGVNNGETKIKCVTEDGAITRECVVTVNGFRRSSSVFTNFGKIENNVTYNTKVEEDGKKYKDYIVDTSNDEYMEFRFNRGETKEWASVLAWYAQLDTITSLDVEVELVSGNLPAIMVEFAGEDNYKQFKRISLTQGQTSTLHVNVTDYNMKTGESGDGSYGMIFLELNNPNDESDTYRKADENVVLRLRKLSMTEGEKELPGKINNFRYEKSLKKLVFEKEVASTGYDLEVYSIEGETETKLDLDVRPTRFSVAGEKIPNMECMFIPKNGEDFSKVPGSYRARIRAVNSAGEGEWSNDAYFTIEGQGTGEEITGYTSVNIANDGAINPNEHNQNQTYKTELTDNGYKVSFTSDTAIGSWDSVLATFDKYAKYSELIVKFEVTNSAVPLNEVLIQFNDWGEGDAGTDGLIQSYNDISGKTGIIEIHVPITKDLSLGLGQIGLCFDRTPGAGDVEILIKHLELVPAGEPVESSYVHTGLSNNGAIVPNSSYNQGPNKDSYKSELVEEGYKLSFTGTASGEWDSWDSFIANYDPSLEYTSLTLKYKVLKSDNPINKIIIELGGDGSSKIQQWFTTSEGYNSETCIYTLQLTLPGSMAGFWGIISLQFDHNANLGETEILVTELSMQ